LNIQFNKGVIELCIFSILSKKEYYAYELVKIISSCIKIPMGTLYPLLRQLISDGFIETYIAELEGESKKFYRLTKKGFEAKESYVLEWHDILSRVNNLIKED
jgi:PadR family transcriptional regulator PadR